MDKENNIKERKEFSAGVVLFREENGRRKYLVLHYPGGHFDFPKGHLEAGETEETAALRELAEETGVRESDMVQGFRDVIHYDFHRREILVRKTVTFFLARTAARDIKISHEHKGYLWLTYEEALQKITFENARAILKKAEEYINHNSSTK